ncbi:MAG: hypothetical protein ACK4YD_01295 [Chitinophagia bacterium]|jgi:hypothetical protein
MKIIPFIFGLVFSLTVLGQQKGKSVAKLPEPQVAVPLAYTSSWGPVISGNALAAQIAAIAPAAILVKDSNGKLYTVESFRLLYKFKSTYRDEEKGETKSRADLRVGDFTNTSRLSEVWYESIKDNVKAGDTIIVNRILFRNPSGKLQMAPEIRIGVR